VIVFAPAMRMVFAMCDSDIFRRFVLSMQYKAMLHDPVSVEALALRTHHRQRHSFSIVPMEEEYSLVRTQARRWEQALWTERDTSCQHSIGLLCVCVLLLANS
jgi:hypothetical protein